MAAVSSSQPTITTLFAEPKLAYAVLQAAEWSIYLTNFITYFGRTTPKHPVDVDLQDDSTISRRHAKIEYNFEEKRFEISALGKNPVIINGKITLRRYDEPLPLTSKMLVRMGTYSFFFILPKAKPQGKRKAEALPAASGGSVPAPPKKAKVAPPPPPPEPEKPNMWADLILDALANAPDHRWPFGQIVDWIAQNYEAYSDPEEVKWQGSIRHQLSINSKFKSEPRRESDPPGKGGFWTITDVKHLPRTRSHK